MINDRSTVRWQDGTYDRGRRCDECQSLTCKDSIHFDRYKEVGSEKEPIEKYWEWMDRNDPLGGEYNALGEYFHNEFYNANPDNLPIEERVRTSGTKEDQYHLMQDAFEALSKQQQKVWSMIMRDQITQDEAAKKLNVTRSTIQKHLDRAKIIVVDYLRSHDASIE